MALPLQRELRFFDPGPGEQDGRWVGWGTGGGPVQTTTVIKVRSMASPRLPLDTPALKRWMVIVSQVREIMWSQLSRLTLCHVHLRFFATFFSLFLSSYPNVLQPTDSASFEEKRRCDVPIHSVAPGFLLNLRVNYDTLCRWLFLLLFHFRSLCSIFSSLKAFLHYPYR